MKWTVAASLAVAPVALAKSVHNVYPVGVDRRSPPSHDATPPGRDSSHGGLMSTSTVVEEEIIILWINPGNNAATTTISTGMAVTATATGTMGTQTHEVTVGGTSLAYNPSSLMANVGDTVIFTFLSQNHTVTQSAFMTPCEKLEGGMDTGFMPNPNNTMNPPPKVAMQVMTTTPTCEYWLAARDKRQPIAAKMPI
jgi:plastocyanin